MSFSHKNVEANYRCYNKFERGNSSKSMTLFSMCHEHRAAA